MDFHLNCFEQMIIILFSMSPKVNISNCFELLCKKIDSIIFELLSNQSINEAEDIMTKFLKTTQIFDHKVIFI